jgi:hypothetical protein
VATGVSKVGNGKVGVTAEDGPVAVAETESDVPSSPAPHDAKISTMATARIVLALKFNLDLRTSHSSGFG